MALAQTYPIRRRLPVKAAPLNGNGPGYRRCHTRKAAKAIGRLRERR
jgi:hypothetical protein